MDPIKKRGYEDAMAKKKMEPNCSQAYYQGYLVGLCDLMDKEKAESEVVDSNDEAKPLED